MDKPNPRASTGSGPDPAGTAPAAGDLPILLFPSVASWERWLDEHHAQVPGIWMRLAKKGSTLSSITYTEAVESALCFGWIDGQAKRHDDDSYLQRFTPRGRRSVWSKINVARVDALTQAGRMRPAGLAAVEAARRDGRLAAAYDAPSTAAVPDDLKEELARRPAAHAFFESLNATNRYAILHRLQTARKPEKR